MPGSPDEDQDERMAQVASAANRRAWLSRVTRHPFVAGRVIARYAWGNYLAWPAPIWRLVGRARVSVCGQELMFSARGGNVPIHMYRRMRRGDWEPRVVGVAEVLGRESRVLFDIGAWVGQYTLFFARLIGQRGKVVAFEPDPIARLELKRNLRLNGIDNVEVIAAAVSDRAGQAKIAAETVGRSGTRVGPGSSDDLTMDVTTLALDSLCMERGLWPDIVKIDVEGGEVAVFAGGREALARARFIILELHPQLMQDAHFGVGRIMRALLDSGKILIDDHGRRITDQEIGQLRRYGHVLAIESGGTEIAGRVMDTLARHTP